MKNRASKLDARVDKVAAGFTIIETILFIAIAGLVFTGVIAGTNGAIRRQRYKDAVQSFTDDLRDLYSIVENTEVLDYGSDQKVTCGTSTSNRNTGRGRSACSVYGIIVRINLDSNPEAGKENIQSYWLIGKDEKEVRGEIPTELTNLTDSRFLYLAEVSPRIKMNDGEQMVEANRSSLFWGAELSIACQNGSYLSSAVCADPTKKTITADEGKVLYLLIYRSPISGGTRTMISYSDSDIYFDANNPIKFDIETATASGVNDEKRTDHNGGLFGREEVKLCVTAGKGMSYSGGLRMVAIKKDASIQDDVRLVEADDEENICN